MPEVVRIRRAEHAQFGHTLTSVRLAQGLPSVEELNEELIGYTQVLLGREPSPVESPYLSLQEVATAYHSRAREIEMMILFNEQTGTVMRGSPYYKFRTGVLNSFIDMAKRCADLGSRRLSQETLLHQARL